MSRWISIASTTHSKSSLPIRVGEAAHRLRQRMAQLSLEQHTLELVARRRRRLRAPGTSMRLRQAVPGAQATGDQLQRVTELVLELVAPLLAAHRDGEPKRHSGRQSPTADGHDGSRTRRVTNKRHDRHRTGGQRRELRRAACRSRPVRVPVRGGPRGRNVSSARSARPSPGCPDDDIRCAFPVSGDAELRGQPPPAHPRLREARSRSAPTRRTAPARRARGSSCRSSPRSRPREHGGVDAEPLGRQLDADIRESLDERRPQPGRHERALVTADTRRARRSSRMRTDRRG